MCPSHRSSLRLRASAGEKRIFNPAFVTLEQDKTVSRRGAEAQRMTENEIGTLVIATARPRTLPCPIDAMGGTPAPASAGDREEDNVGVSLAKPALQRDRGVKPLPHAHRR